MKRRQALLRIAGLGAALLALRDAGAQSKVPVIGLLDAGERQAWWTAFRHQMTQLGHVEGKNIAYEARYAKGKLALLPGFAQELVQRKVAVIVTAALVATQAARRATDTIPIVTATGGDHVSMGFANSLARPGGNVTGVSSISTELTAKRLEILREALPKMQRFAAIWQTDNTGSRVAFRDLERAALESKVTLLNLGIQKPEDLAGAFLSAAKERANAVYLVPGPMIFDARRQTGELALKHKLPTMHGNSEELESGGLLSFGASYLDLFRRAAFYVDKILKGAKPGELPIENPAKLEFVINRKTAKALGVEIPKTLLLRADRVFD